MLTVFTVFANCTVLAITTEVGAWLGVAQQPGMRREAGKWAELCSARPPGSETLLITHSPACSSSTRLKHTRTSRFA